MAKEVIIGNQTFKRRNPFAVWIGLPIITLGIYHFVWYYKINKEAKRYLQDESIKPGRSLLALTLGWIIIVPPFISVYNTGQRVRRMQENAGITERIDPIINFILIFVSGLYSLYLQYNLNKVWDAYLTQGSTAQGSQAVSPPPLPPPSPIEPPLVSPPPPPPPV